MELFIQRLLNTGEAGFLNGLIRSVVHSRIGMCISLRSLMTMNIVAEEAGAAC